MKVLIGLMLLVGSNVYGQCKVEAIQDCVGCAVRYVRVCEQWTPPPQINPYFHGGGQPLQQQQIPQNNTWSQWGR